MTPLLASLYPRHLEYVRAAFDAAMDRAGADTVVVYAGGLRMAFLDDHAMPFIANPHFKYWIPVGDAPDSYVIYRNGRTPVIAYCQPDDFWHAPPAEPDEAWAKHFDVRITRSAAEAKAHLPEDGRSAILLGEIQQPAQALGIERINPSAALHALDFSRAAKTAYELERMRMASRDGAIAHTAARDAFLNGHRSELELHQAYLAAIAVIDAELPYPSIVALNEHAGVLHYQFRERTAPEEPRTFLIDAGASAAGYASDITRTYTRHDGLFADLIEAMDALQQTICATVREGVHFPDLHRTTHDHLASLLLETGLARGSAEALVERGITRALLPHGLGHYLGLQVHDVAGHLAAPDGQATERPASDPALRLTRTLSADEVVTIEPGLYFIESLLEPLRQSGDRALLDWSAIDALVPYGGIRIEDDVRVRDAAPENLTRDAFAAIGAA